MSARRNALLSRNDVLKLKSHPRWGSFPPDVPAGVSPSTARSCFRFTSCVLEHKPLRARQVNHAMTELRHFLLVLVQFSVPAFFPTRAGCGGVKATSTFLSQHLWFLIIMVLRERTQQTGGERRTPGRWNPLLGELLIYCAGSERREREKGGRKN